MERLQICNVSISNGNIKCPIGKSFSLHTFLTKCLYHMLVKFEQIRIVRTTQNFEFFDKKNRLFKIIFDKMLTHFWKAFL